MKEYLEIQKNAAALFNPIILGFAFMIFSIVLICTYFILGIIFAVCTVVGVTVSLCILVANGEISKVRISGQGIRIKEKAGLQFIPWEDFTNCEVEHMGRGLYKFILMVGEKRYRIYHSIDILEKIVCFCSVPEFTKVLKAQINKA